MNDTIRPIRGVLLRDDNDDVISFDDSGLRMNLSDHVVEDIRHRLSGERAMSDLSVLGDIHAWDLRQCGEWYTFTANLAGSQGISQFRRNVQPTHDLAPDIFANPTSYLFALLAIGGSRRGTTADEPLMFPYHIVSTGDDMGPAGSSGSVKGEPNNSVQTLTEQTCDSLTADKIVGMRKEAFRGLPVIYARTETDNSYSVKTLTTGVAMTNLKQTVDNLCDAASSMNVAPKILAIGLDFTLEAVLDDAASWLTSMHELMHEITNILSNRGLRKPLFIARFDAGTQVLSDHPILRAQWDLAWNKGDHDHVYSAPGYMFGQDEFGRPTARARQQMAQMDAFAIEAHNADEDWACPLLLLAEREDDPKVIRCRGQALGSFVLDPDDPLNAGDTHGFRLLGARNDAHVVLVVVDPDAENDLLVHLDKAPKGNKLILCYAMGADAATDGMPANRGSLRDDWSQKDAEGEALYRWALPATLPVH